LKADFENIWQEGSSLSVEQAIELALEENE
jgi:hypothetical protein